MAEARGWTVLFHGDRASVQENENVLATEGVTADGNVGRLTTTALC